jgi:pimeloyl-ACP methyl ester carboxylesterase
MPLTEEGLVFVPQLLSRWVRLPSGARAHYMTAGETGPAVVLLHGGMQGSSGVAGWRFMAPFLAANGFRVYCPDFPGFGLSDTRFRSPWPGSHLEFLTELVDTLCLDRFHIAGNSMGSVNTCFYVTNHPDRVISFALIAGGVGDVVSLEHVTPPETVAGRNGPVSYDGTKESMRKMMTVIINDESVITDDVLDMRVRAAELQEDAFAAFWPGFSSFMLRGTLDDPNLEAKYRTRDRLEHLTIPGVYLFGREDRLIPVENGYRQEDALPNVQFFYPDDCGHQGQSDRPDLFNELFLEFFRDGRVSRATADRAGVSKRRPELAHLVEAPTVPSGASS